MAERWVVECVHKVRAGEFDVIDKFRLRYEGGLNDGRVITVSKSEAIEMVRSGEDIFVINRPISLPSRDRRLGIEVSDDGNEYLATGADTTGANNLGGVPECSDDGADHD